ncbi:MAG: VOC family protein [Oscillospiraceae bacterium]|nr:VOC family protein [Oscillospiraceae bacterium]
MKIEHTALYVGDLERARDFFVKYFNAVSSELYHNAKTDFKSYFLSFDGGARLEIMHRPDVSEKNGDLRLGYAHIAFSVGSRENVNSLTERLRADGYQTVSEPRITGDGYYESCIADFDGNLIEITV